MNQPADDDWFEDFDAVVSAKRGVELAVDEDSRFADVFAELDAIGADPTPECVAAPDLSRRELDPQELVELEKDLRAPDMPVDTIAAGSAATRTIPDFSGPDRLAARRLAVTNWKADQAAVKAREKERRAAISEFRRAAKAEAAYERRKEKDRRYQHASRHAAASVEGRDFRPRTSLKGLTEEQKLEHRRKMERHKKREQRRRAP